MRPSRLKRPRAPAPQTPPPGDYTIERLGTDGAGMVRHAGTWFAIPLTLPGEQVRLARSGARADIIEASPDRAVPPCPHFGDCGGCRLQHLSTASYQDYKRQLVVDSLARVGLHDVPVSPARVSPPGTRRRANLKAIRTHAGILLGFNAIGDSRLVDITTCPLLVPAIANTFPAFRALLLELLPPGRKANVILTETESGIDAGIAGLGEADLRMLERLAAFAHGVDLARLWLVRDDEPPIPVAERRRPIVRLGGHEVALPPGGFLQATAPGEQALVGIAREALAPHRRVADLFSGIGTFTLALAGNHRIQAFEQDRAAVQALEDARNSAGLANVQVLQRDLHQRPLTAEELLSVDAVLFDPPRAGASPQARELAGSKVSRIVAVSCNPATFARDAVILLGGGYRLERVDVVDQFLWSPHVELIAIFDRPAQHQPRPASPR